MVNVSMVRTENSLRIQGQFQPNRLLHHTEEEVDEPSTFGVMPFCPNGLKQKIGPMSWKGPSQERSLDVLVKQKPGRQLKKNECFLAQVLFGNWIRLSQTDAQLSDSIALERPSQLHDTNNRNVSSGCVAVSCHTSHAHQIDHQSCRHPTLIWIMRLVSFAIITRSSVIVNTWMSTSPLKNVFVSRLCGPGPVRFQAGNNTGTSGERTRGFWLQTRWGSWIRTLSD